MLDIRNANGGLDFSKLDPKEIEAMEPDKRERLFAFRDAVEAELALNGELKAARNNSVDLGSALQMAQHDLEAFKPKITAIQATRQAIETWKRFG